MRSEQSDTQRLAHVAPTPAQAEASAATMGVIERVDMINFMCHRNLSIGLGPRINFIIGHNGSGKSAILTAITIALGGKATTTSRGSSLKDFIREGSSAAEVRVRMRNKGLMRTALMCTATRSRSSAEFTRTGLALGRSRTPMERLSRQSARNSMLYVTMRTFRLIIQ